MRRLGSGLVAVLGIAFAMPGLAQDLRQIDQAPGDLYDLTGEFAANEQAGRKMYIVQMIGEPGVSYEGGIASFAATRPAPGDKYNASASHVQQYTEHLVTMHDQKLASIGAAGQKIYSYRHAMNGFAAMLTPAEAAKLRGDKSVMEIFEDFAYAVETNNSPDFLGLNDRREGLRKKQRLNGEDVVIGVLDTGAVQEHPSFSDRRTFDLPPFCDNPDRYVLKRVCKKLERFKNQVVYDAPPADWQGICQEGEAWAADDCNNKLIGARWYVDGFIAGRGSVVEGEFLSPRDSSGHGSHTASTAGGNHVTASLNGVRLDRISGMAPRARIAVYKVCWLSPGATNFSCFFSDSAAATDQAVADGVDVLNFSVGTALTFADTQDLAFLRAADAGVFVARSAGNDGPGFATTSAGEPWVTSVAASTLTGTGYALGVSVSTPPSVAGDYPFTEANFTLPLSEGGPVSGELAAADPLDACDPLTNVFDGKIALITRGACTFQTKLDNAVAAGASAAIVFNNQPGRIIMAGSADPGISAVMINNEPGLALVDALTAMEVVNVFFSATNFITEDLEGNIMAGFSSRGPYTFESDFVKPDITAPGVRILAAYAPDQADGSQGDIFAYLQGTSMSSPHIAGLGALVKEAHPDWSPAQIKSALMTTARQDVVKEDGTTPADPFDFGAGHVDPNGAVDPGLTYDAGLFDYYAATCGTVRPLVTPGSCDFLASVGFSLEPADLNLPSIGIGQLAGSQTVTRTVTAVDGYRRDRGNHYGWWNPNNQSKGPTPYHAVIEAPPGYSVHVSPNTLHLNPGESADYELTITNDSAPPGEWFFGAVTWVDSSGHEVRSPIAVNGVAIVAPEEVFGAGEQGSLSFDVEFGYTGAYTAGTHGLAEASVDAGRVVADDPNNSYDPFSGVGIDQQLYGFGPGVAFARFATFDANTDGNDDLDLYLWECDAETFGCTNIDASTTFTAEEQVEVLLPQAFFGFGNPGIFYVLEVHGFETDGPEAVFDQFVWDFGLVDDRGNMIVTAPGAATVGATETITVDWPGANALNPGAKYLGAVSHSDANGLLGLTLINISTE